MHKVGGAGGVQRDDAAAMARRGGGERADQRARASLSPVGVGALQMATVGAERDGRIVGKERCRIGRSERDEPAVGRA